MTARTWLLTMVGLWWSERRCRRRPDHAETLRAIADARTGLMRTLEGP